MTRKPVVLITDNINPTAVKILDDTCEVVFEKSLTPEQLLEKIPNADALMIRSASTVTQDVLKVAPNLKIVGRAGVGTDNIDLKQATQHGVIVVNSPEGNTVAASEHTVVMLMAMVRHIPEADVSMKAGKWDRKKLTGVELFGKTLGLIGLGKIGSRVAKACMAMGMKVKVYDPYLSPAHAENLGVEQVELEVIWETADFITLHVPKTRETTNLVNKETFAKCKPGVRFINCARGGIINEADLAEALKNGQVAAAALDVFDGEPLDTASPLLSLGEHQNKIVLTPHLGASTEEAQVNVAIDVAEQIRDFFTHGSAQNAVNIPMLRKELLDPVREFMPMAEVLGNLVRQLAKGATQSIEMTAKGTLSEHKTSPLTLAVLKGLLSHAREGVNYVNAPVIADEAGFKVKESSVSKAENYTNQLVVTLTTTEGTYQVAGTLIAEGHFKITEVDGYLTALDPTPNVLFAPHHDRPGMVAKVASTLGDTDINISALQVA
nr:phosphoglycerate dehydrogenase [Vampirovibrio sp.]